MAKTSIKVWVVIKHSLGDSGQLLCAFLRKDDAEKHRNQLSEAHREKYGKNPYYSDPFEVAEIRLYEPTGGKHE